MRKNSKPAPRFRREGSRLPAVRFFTLGCKANQYDTQSIRERFLSRGFREAKAEELPDYFLINTCTVTSSADQKSRNIIRRCVQSGPRPKVIVTGCLVEKDWEEIKKIEGVYLVVKKSFFPDEISGFSQRTRAFLKIQDGCDNFCSYCKVALVRGRPRSKPLKDLLREAGRLAAAGYKEIVLTGICLGSYGKGEKNGDTLIEVIGSLEKIEGLERIRLSSIEAGDVTSGLIRCLRRSKKFCRHLHIPMQSGDDRILRLMNRKYGRENYKDLVSGLKSAVPGISITTDCMVGFPGETETAFRNTLDLVKSVKPLKVHIFPYSVRPYTRAAGFTGKVAPETIRRRGLELSAAAAECREDFMEGFTGKSARVLVEGRFKEQAGYLEGLTDNYLRVKLPFAPGARNNTFAVRLKSLSGDLFTGEYIDNP
ncbi:MAG: MiaB/RimO family radical SAM methylthiotransferase [Candidatus Omnitrophica bacterium]|jgi:threonylcarbamoyladenosine tRNA methylthiotransferase MtaB|nr:MiaB/RimO family radical SAM methylthiotransferase [Candidatus Omnitrophota bacterium]MDD5078247.1 MiaB/RimO family radical SAM methylthiotransferase [Candidatus Omnitrophota bacterium]MDD5725092.1 MiaB/RimO family radical SAM methylthiotransferase [Candidatus Omnitrophota bacterium]